MSALILYIFYKTIDVYTSGVYQSVWSLLSHYGVAFITLLVVYFVWIDRYLKEPCDSYWYLGQLGMERLYPNTWKVLAEHLRCWTIKGFFLPIMFASLVYLLNVIHIEASNIQTWDFLTLFMAGWLIVFLIDLVFATGGYLLTLRPLNSHIRSTDTTVPGWGVALICYQPFWGYVQHYLLNYQRENINWSMWLADMPVLYVI